MGIIGSMLRRREPGGGYRTIDGGHPAPFPDMTDEQLYNYEITFDVPRKTFDRPPVPFRTEDASAAAPAPEMPAAAPVFEKPKASPKVSDKVLDSARFSARKLRTQAAAVAPAAPREVAADPAPLDFSRPVRVITTRQPVDIITTRARHPVYKVHGYIGDADVATVFTLDGRLSENGPRFLENVPEQRQLFLNIYLNDDGRSGDRYRLTQHDTQEEADAAAGADRITCVALQLER